MMNEVMRLDPQAIVGLLKRINGLDLEKEAQRNQNCRSNSVDFLANISQSKKDQQMEFGLIVVFGLTKMVYGSDQALDAQITNFEEKKGQHF